VEPRLRGGEPYKYQEGGGEEVKYIAFLEICPEKVDKFVETYETRVTSKKTVKFLFPPHTIAKTTEGFTGFTLFESNDEMELAEYVTDYTMAGARVKVYPIWEFAKGIKLLKK